MVDAWKHFMMYYAKQMLAFLQAKEEVSIAG